MRGGFFDLPGPKNEEPFPIFDIRGRKNEGPPHFPRSRSEDRRIPPHSSSSNFPFSTNGQELLSPILKFGCSARSCSLKIGPEIEVGPLYSTEDEGRHHGADGDLRFNLRFEDRKREILRSSASKNEDGGFSIFGVEGRKSKLGGSSIFRLRRSKMGGVRRSSGFEDRRASIIFDLRSRRTGRTSDRRRGKEGVRLLRR